MANILTFVSLVIIFFIFSEANATAPRRALSSADTITAFLNPQNAVRAKLRLPPLQWSNKLVTFAKWYANQRRGDCALIHSTSDYGENLFWGQGNRWKISDAIAAWAAEQTYYNYGANTCSPGADCTHYTQMVWRTTTRVGKLLDGKEENNKLSAVHDGLIISERDGVVILGVRPPASRSAAGSERMLDSVPSPGVGH
ncbi:hypothetical protein J5N97_004722 [Dioscorea zingiberensis]|uniref:SCP domain-containing protein n=1 Tax=Dioscorea zingiberensis TaxID=325984 RepID=A0A9D5D772_9LILI|nr:hypothetical protein J5N97_004722 [Dioscorea zingiberensis]